MKTIERATKKTARKRSLERVVRARVVTEYIRPPIPTTAFDWIAYREGQEEGNMGFGGTETEAITELLESEE